MSMKDNFWQMGDTGPCGPCSEIFFDLGVAASETGEDKPFPHDDQRYIEIWNLVFMQFDRAADGTLTPLPKPSIDTGMGLERISCVLQGRLSNYESDLFTPLIAAAKNLTAFKSELSLEQLAVSDEKGAASLRIIADHARAATFLISDGVLPSNEGRGYVLRKIMRRGIRHGRLLGQEKPFLHEMVFAVRDEMQTAYPELKDAAQRVSKVVLAEEQQFARVLEVGARKLDEAITAHLAGPHANNAEVLRQAGLVREAFSKHTYFSGQTAFHLYETYGLPVDFISDALRDAGIPFDIEGFERSRQEEQARARASWKGGS